MSHKAPRLHPGMETTRKGFRGMSDCKWRDNVSLVQSCFMARDWGTVELLYHRYKTWNNYKHKIFLVLFPLKQNNTMCAWSSQSVGPLTTHNPFPSHTHTHPHPLTYTHTHTHSPFISRGCEDSGPVLYPPQDPSALSLPLVDHQHLICIQRIGLLYVRTLHAQRVQEQGAGTSGVNV